MMDPAVEMTGKIGPGMDARMLLRDQLRELLTGQPVVTFANDWNGDPTSKHHIMRTLGEHTDVLWVESSGMRRPEPSLADLRRIMMKLHRARRKGVEPASTPVRVASPLALPFPGSRVAERVNARLYRRTLERAGVFEDPARPPLIWVYTPTVAPYLDGLPSAGLVYHCVDRWWAFSEYDEDVMRRHHIMLCRSADVVFASSQELVHDCEHFTDNVHLIRHGVDWEHFAAAALKPPPAPHDVADIEGPVLGFFGLIHDWIDQTLLARVADVFPQATLVLIGKTRVDFGELAKRPNVRLLGQKAYAELPAYAARFDAGLIPFAMNDLTRAVNPIKLREYLSAGLPVVSTALPELAVYADHPRVSIASDTDGFLNAVAEVLRRNDPDGARADAARTMASESWLGRCTTMVRLWRESRDTATAV